VTARERPWTVIAAGVLGIVSIGVAALVATVISTPAPAGSVVRPGPIAADYLPIEEVPVVLSAPAPGPNASTGSFTSPCGRNLEGHRNSDNVIAAPGLSNGAHHIHDYVGNLSADRTSTESSLAAGGTTCNLDDRSVYFWPVLRDIRRGDADADRPGGGQDGNFGRILTPARVSIDFLGNPRSPVTPMPRFLRIVTGNAKAATTGVNARARWSCSGTPGRVTGTFYPLCPDGQLVQRTAEFPSCWNGTDIDSKTHRTHVTFPEPATGACPVGTVAIPRLRIILAYQVPPGRSYAIDSFPDQERRPLTDHFDFLNVMPESLMREAVGCINAGRNC
jgi:hypothetical protein